MEEKQQAKNIQAIDTVKLPDNVINTTDDWFDAHGEALLEFITKSVPTTYECDPERRWELDITKGWQDKYLHSLYKHMASGKSYASYGGRHGISTSRKKLWEQQVIEWRVVRDFGEMVCREKWEDLGIRLVEGDIIGGNASVYNATMKALFADAYGDKKEIEHKHLHGGRVEFVLTEHKSEIPLLENDSVYTELIEED